MKYNIKLSSKLDKELTNLADLLNISKLKLSGALLSYLSIDADEIFLKKDGVETKVLIK